MSFTFPSRGNLCRYRSPLSLVDANREIDKRLRGGVKARIPGRERGGQRTEVGSGKEARDV